MRALGRGSLASFIKVALEVQWWFLWIAAAALVLGTVGYLIVVGMIEGGMLEASLLEPGQGRQTIGPITIETDKDDQLSWQLVSIGLLGGAVAIGGSLVIIQRLRRLFASFTTGDPFSRDNATHLRVIWIAMLVMELSRYAIAGTVMGLVTLLGQPGSTEINVQSPVNFLTWAAIMILIVLAEVFREGARLREEQDLTI